MGRTHRVGADGTVNVVSHQESVLCLLYTSYTVIAGGSLVGGSVSAHARDDEAGWLGDHRLAKPRRPGAWRGRFHSGSDA